ncbi:MAG: multiprotein-bridging factor 1 family protein [Halolamina sp.]
MAKYSTGGSGGGDDGDACELCGREGTTLSQATVAGADLLVCSDCEPHGSSGSGRGSTGGGSGSGPSARSGSGPSSSSPSPTTGTTGTTSSGGPFDATGGDSEHWEEEGTDYEDDRLPYLVADYGDRTESARQELGLTVDELAAAVDADEDDVLSVEQGRATRAGVGGSLVRRLEEELDVTLVDE